MGGRRLPARAAARALLETGLHALRSRLDAHPDPWEELRRELLRSRRYRHVFVVARIPRNGSSLTRASGLATFLRRTDRIWSVGDDVYVLLPETDRERAEALLTRIRREAPRVLPMEGVRVAVFPLEGVTVGAMLAALDGRDLDEDGFSATWLDGDPVG